jgi:hypothetical protein
MPSPVGVQSHKIEAQRCRDWNGGFGRFLWPVRRTLHDGFGSAAASRSLTVIINSMELAAGEAAKAAGESAVTLIRGNGAEVLIFDLPE